VTINQQYTNETATWNTISIDPNDYTKIQKKTTSELFDGKRVVLFAVPGAFTPTCSDSHLPGFLKQYEALVSKGVDVMCTSVNDVHVMRAWANDRKVGNKIRMLADGTGEFAKKLGLLFDASNFGLGYRSRRYAMIINNNIIEYIGVDTQGVSESAASLITSKL